MERAKASLDSFEKFTRAALKQFEANSPPPRRRSASARKEIHAGLLEKIEEQIAGCTITAPSPGVVFYADSQGDSQEDGSAIGEGSLVRLRQVILRLSRLDAWSIRLEVREVEMPLLSKGMPAEIYLDVAPGRMLAGEVARSTPTHAGHRDSDTNSATTWWSRSASRQRDPAPA